MVVWYGVSRMDTHFFKASIPLGSLLYIFLVFQNHPCGKYLLQQGIDQFCSPNSSDNFCLLFCRYPCSLNKNFRPNESANFKLSVKDKPPMLLYLIVNEECIHVLLLVPTKKNLCSATLLINYCISLEISMLPYEAILSVFYHCLFTRRLLSLSFSLSLSSI